MNTITGKYGEYIYLATIAGYSEIGTLIELPYNPDEIINRVKTNSLPLKFINVDSQGWGGCDTIISILKRKCYRKKELVADNLNLKLNGIDYDHGHEYSWTITIDSLYCLGRAGLDIRTVYVG